ncbi:MAG: hypothetical protein H6865_04770 [Rhodospirillales bacterium]|nr:hypothetical protein [Alphaproteobacteria bacterium]MCB9986931.1 hypothetical protein [Rhodospirillales bacterium]USO08294.1 MAG: hypothetical protein H6866_03520 [Rhodospirillales bacterium]
MVTADYLGDDPEDIFNPYEVPSAEIARAFAAAVAQAGEGGLVHQVYGLGTYTAKGYRPDEIPEELRREFRI